MTIDTYVLPDLTNVRESREAIRYQAIVGSANLYIKALSDELNALRTAIDNMDLVATNAINSAVMSLDTDELRENLKALIALKERPADAETQEAIKAYSTIANQQMSLCTDQISQLHEKLEGAVFNVQSANISNNRSRLAELADAKLALEQQHSAEQLPVAELNADLTVLNEAIKEFEKLTIIDRLKPLLDQLKLLVGKPQAPKAAALEAGIIVANKFLDEANELIRYEGLIKARGIIQTRLSQREERVSSLEKQLRENDDRAQQLEDTQKVLPHRETYVNESSKLIDSLNTFLDTVMNASTDEVLARGDLLVKNSQALQGYMKKIQGRWLR